MKILMIVESPAKSKTITKYLQAIDKNNTYTVLASFGHVRDLPPKELAIDVEDHFKPSYVILKKDIVKKLKSAAAEADMIYLASDPDREGEAISWHLQQTLRPKKYKRVVFHEISQNALQTAIQNPKDMDMHLVDAQQTRRLIDRLMGFKISPLLWKAFGPGGWSAGRVQSACLNLVAQKHQARLEFGTSEQTPAASWSVTGKHHVLKHALSTRLMRGSKNSKNTETVVFTKSKDVLDFLQSLGKEPNWTLQSVTQKERTENPGVPYTTSSLQQDASSKLSMDIKSTMKIAQDLYEAGHITYMRTDSHVLSAEAMRKVHAFVSATYGADHVQERNFAHKNAKNSQEAHEAIRPTQFDSGPDYENTIQALTTRFSARHAALYSMIFKRTVSSQMIPAIYSEAVIAITWTRADHDEDKGTFFQGTLSALTRPGWLRVYDKTPEEAHSLKNTDVVTCTQVEATQTFDTPPSYYTEASLVKLLEKEGLGRPSTYAAILSKLYDKEYIQKQNLKGEPKACENYVWTPQNSIQKKKETVHVGAQKNALVPTDTGLNILAYLNTHFEDMISPQMTASMETQLDTIASGEATMQGTLTTFWGQLKGKVDAATEATKTVANNAQKEKYKEKEVVEFQIQDKTYWVREARYGPVIEHEENGKKAYVSLGPYLEIFGSKLSDVTQADVTLLTSIPQALTGPMQGWTLHYGRYGFYLIGQGPWSVSIPGDFVKGKRNENENGTTFVNRLAPELLDEFREIRNRIKTATATTGKGKKQNKEKKENKKVKEPKVKSESTQRSAAPKRKKTT